MYEDLSGESPVCYICGAVPRTRLYIPRTTEVEIEMYPRKVKLKVCNTCCARYTRHPTLTVEAFVDYCTILKARGTKRGPLKREDKIKYGDVLNHDGETYRLAQEDPLLAYGKKSEDEAYRQATKMYQEDLAKGVIKEEPVKRMTLEEFLGDIESEQKLSRPPEGEVLCPNVLIPEDRGQGAPNPAEDLVPSPESPEWRLRTDNATPDDFEVDYPRRVLSTETPADTLKGQETLAEGVKVTSFQELLALYAQTGELQTFMMGAEVHDMVTMTMKRPSYVTLEDSILKIYLV